MHVLVIEDDVETARYLRKGLAESGHAVALVHDGREGLAAALDHGFHGFDVAVVDRMLPGLDGLSLIATLRRERRRLPVLVLSALAQVDDRVRGLKAGGDDYLTKPFAFSELLARLEALARRAGGEGDETRLRVADLELDLLSRVVTRAGREIALQRREFELLAYFMHHAGQVVTRTMLLERVWGYHFDPRTNVIDVHVSRLRRKIDKGFDGPLIHTVRGVGYSLRARA